jgi:hypothetical protein
MRLLANLVFAFLLTASWAARADDIWAVEMSVFSCPGCAEFEPYSERLSQEMGGRLAVAALPDGADAPLARAYYAMREYGDARAIRRVMYQMVVNLRMTPTSSKQVIEWVRMNGVSIPYDEAVRDVRSTRVDDSIVKAVRLAEMGNIQGTPTILFVQGGQVLTSVAKLGRNPDVFLNDVLDTARRLKALESQRPSAATTAGGQ